MCNQEDLAPIEGSAALDSLLQRQAVQVGELAHQAMITEVRTTPKPGLVDQRNRGAHDDMDLATFEASASAVAPWLPRFTRLGIETAVQPADSVLAELRLLTTDCEQEMLKSTGGVNTHRGMLFSLALVCAATGRLLAGRHSIIPEAVGRTVAAICKDMVARELAGSISFTLISERLYHRYGLTGLRGEAESGYATVLCHGLPAYQALKRRGVAGNLALLQTLLVLMANCADSNIVVRDGLEALRYVQERAQALLRRGGALASDGLHALEQFDRDLIARQLSPGGSADLLAVTWLLHELEAWSSATQ